MGVTTTTERGPGGMSGEALFWIGIVVFTVVMLIAFVVMDRPRKGRGVSTRHPAPIDTSDPRGRHDLAERVDPRESGDRL